MIVALRNKLYTLFVTKPVTFALINTGLDVAIGVVIGVVIGAYVIG